MQRVTMTWMRYHTSYHIISDISLVLNYLQCITVNFFKKILIYIFLYKFDGNT